MDLSSAKWLSELEMDDPTLKFNHQWEMMNSIYHSVNDDISFHQFSSDHGSCSTHQSSGAEKKLPELSQTSILKPPNQLINNSSTDSRLYNIFGQETYQKSSSSPSPRIISFGNDHCNLPASSSQRHNIGKPKYTVKAETDEMMLPLLESIDFSSDIISSITSLGKKHGPVVEHGVDPLKKGCSRTPLQAQDHVLAERKRRENLSQQFISLAAIVPGLNKLDKASVIGGAIKHIKQLEERVKFYEEEEKKRKSREESVVSAKRPRTSSVCHNNDDTSSWGETSESSCDEQSSTAEIEVRTLGGDVLIRVQCKKYKGIMSDFFSQMEKIHLSVTSSCFMPFGDNMLLINAVAQMDEEFSMTTEDLANHIRQLC